jgi:hypothetical protein
MDRWCYLAAAMALNNTYECTVSLQNYQNKKTVATQTTCNTIKNNGELNFKGYNVGT